MASTFREVATDLINTTQMDVMSRWYHSDLDADLFIWMDAQENIIKQHLSFWGQVVEWNVLDGVKTGLIVEDEIRGTAVGDPESVRFDQTPQKTPLEQAIALVTFMRVLRDSERRQLLNNFQQGSQGENLSSHQFLERFGLHLKGRRTQSLSARVFSRLKRWFRL